MRRDPASEDIDTGFEQEEAQIRVEFRARAVAATASRLQVNFRASRLAKLLLSKIAKEMGVSATAAFEIIVREAAKKRGIA